MTTGRIFPVRNLLSVLQYVGRGRHQLVQREMLVIQQRLMEGKQAEVCSCSAATVLLKSETFPFWIDLHLIF